MFLPSHLLIVNFLSFERQGNDRILPPHGWTAHKQ